MPRLGRLKKRPEFLRVAGRGRKVATPGLVLQALERCPSPPSADRLPEAQAGEKVATETTMPDLVRVGFTASRKVGKAVERNRARRRLRAAVDEVVPTAGQPGRDYVVVARRGTLSRPWPALLEDLRSALARVETAAPSGAKQSRRRGNRMRKGGNGRYRTEAKEAG